MKNNVVLALTLPAILVLPIMMVSAPTYKVGVKVGYWAKYGMTVFWSVEPPTANLTEPQEVKEAKNIEWIEIKVLRVYGTNVTIEVTTQYYDETEKTGTYSGDVRTGSGNLNLQVIACDLSEGDKVFEAEGALVIKETESGSYAGFHREINCAYPTIPIGEGTYATYNFGWDTATGIVTYILIEQRVTLEDYESVSVITMTMTETNMFQAEASFGPDVIWIVSVGATVMLVAFTYVTMRRKGRKRKKTLTKRLKIILYLPFEKISKEFSP